MGQALDRLGRSAEAVPQLERALRLGGKLNATDLAEVRFSLARALPESERQRAVELATAAAVDFRAAGRRFAPELAEVERWLRARR